MIATKVQQVPLIGRHTLDQVIALLHHVSGQHTIVL
jgi:hypothetical protein